MTEESAPGFRLRQCAANGLGRSAWLGAIRGELSPGERAWRTTRHPRHCPECLAERAVWKNEWTVAFLPICLTHGTWLEDACPTCARPLRWGAMQITKCECGFDLTTRRPKRVPVSTLQALRGIREIAAGPNGATLTAVSLSRLLHALGAPALLPHAARPHRALSRSDLAQCRSVVVSAAPLLHSWPERFEAQLRKIMKAKPRDGVVSPARAFTRVYRCLFRDLADPEFRFVRDAFAAFVARSWPSPLSKRHGALARHLKGSSTVVSVTAAARSAGMRVETFVKLCGRHPTQKHARRRSVSQSAIAMVRARGDAAISIRAAARSLGIGAARVTELRATRLLKSMRATGRGGVWFDGRQVETFAERIAALARPDPRQAETISVAHALRFRLPRGDAPKLVRAILRGAVSVFQGSDKGARLGDLLVPFVALAELTCSTRENQSLSLPDAARALGVKQQVVYALARSGRLRVTRARGRLRTAGRTTKASLTIFKRQYVSAVELAATFGTSPRKAIEKMAERHIRPAIGPDSDGCRQVFFRRMPLHSGRSVNAG